MEDQSKEWEIKPKGGRKKHYETPELLWAAACGYFEWCQNNPLYETVAFSFRGSVTTEELPKMRAMTISQLCFYLGVNPAYFRQLKTSKDVESQGFSTIIHDIETVIYNQKFQGASADLLNANIISRELGLADTMMSDVTVKPGVVVMDAKAAEEMQAMIDKFNNEV